MPELERYILHRLWQLDAHLRQACADFEFHGFYAALHNFCAVELSAFYFDIRKDALYCDRPDSLRRRAARTVLDTLFSYLTAWLAPVLVFTAEEAWLARYGEEPKGVAESVHLRTFPEAPAAWRDVVREIVTGSDDERHQFADVCITSDIQLSFDPPPADAFTLADVPGVAVAPARAKGGKCARCWQVLPEVGGDREHAALCKRCADAVRHVRAAA